MSRRLQIIQHLLARLAPEIRSAAARVQQVRDEIARGQQRAQQIGNYRMEYAKQGVTRLSRGTPPALLLTRQAFDRQLDGLNRQQDDANSALHAQLPHLEAAWQRLLAREAGLKKLAQRLQEEQARQASRREQKMADEWAQNARGFR